MRKPRATYRFLEMAKKCEAGHGQDMRDWQGLLHASRPNGLIVGPDAVCAETLGMFEELLLRPVVHWPRDGAPWDGRQRAATVVLHDVGALAAGDQSALQAWMDDAGRGVQVISLASSSIYPMVQQGAFLETLYYRINCVFVDCSGIPGSR